MALPLVHPHPAQVIVQGVLASSFVAPLQAEAEGWERRLRLVGATYEQWYALQTSYVYLEAVFVAPDIQRQLPKELNHFIRVDRSWKTLMKRVARNPTALRHGTEGGLLEELTESSATLAAVQKRLEEYLSYKRSAFTRFFFLSNDELLDILGQSANPRAVQPHLIKCFANIERLELVDGTASGSVLGVIAMMSVEGERVPFGRAGFKTRGPVEEWLAQLEVAMLTSLQRLTKEAYLDLEQLPLVDWVRGRAAQVILTASQIAWCSAVETALAEADATVRQAALAISHDSGMTSVMMSG